MEGGGRGRGLYLRRGQCVTREHGGEVDLALLAAALPGHDQLLARHAARDEPLLAGEGAVAGELVLDGLGRVERKVRRQHRVGLLGRVRVGAAVEHAGELRIVLVRDRAGLGLGLGSGLGWGQAWGQR